MREGAHTREPVAFIEANPNPVPGGAEVGTTTITWNVGPGGQVGRVLVSRDGEPASVFAVGPTGSQDAPWIQTGHTYEFRLYAEEDQQEPIVVVKVRRGEIPWEAASSALLEYSVNDVHRQDVAQLLAQAISRFAYPPLYEQYFQLWEQNGFHLSPVHFYHPIPDTRALPDKLWLETSELAGIDMNVARQLELLQAFSAFRGEYDQFPTSPTDQPSQFHFNNGIFDGTDALVLYCMVRLFKPNLIVEVGSGMSSRVSADAALRNEHTELVCIEPYPDAVLRNGFPGLSSLIVSPVQEADPAVFQRLDANDILFIDTSHVVKCGGDVNYLYLEVLPRLRPGVIVHIHDIFFPNEYPEDWARRLFRFWNEQYLLQAFLTYNSAFEVLCCNSYLAHYFQEHVRTTFPNSPGWGGMSFWMQRRYAHQ